MEIWVLQSLLGGYTKGCLLPLTRYIPKLHHVVLTVSVRSVWTRRPHKKSCARHSRVRSTVNQPINQPTSQSINQSSINQTNNKQPRKNTSKQANKKPEKYIYMSIYICTYMFYLYLYNCTCAFRPSLDPTTLKPKLTTGAASWQSPDTVLFLSWF